MYTLTVALFRSAWRGMEANIGKASVFGVMAQNASVGVEDF